MLNMSEVTSKSRGAALHFVDRYQGRSAFRRPAFTGCRFTCDSERARQEDHAGDLTCTYSNSPDWSPQL